jgi:polyphosphate kinase
MLYRDAHACLICRKRACYGKGQHEMTRSIDSKSDEPQTNGIGRNATAEGEKNVKDKKSASKQGADAAEDPSRDTAEETDRGPSLDFSYTQNREISWLQFDNRVLDESLDASVPLLERLKMASIFESNLDEFFMIRVGSLSELASLKIQPVDNKSNQTPSEQVEAIYKALPPLLDKHGKSFAAIEHELAAHGVTRVSWNEFTQTDRVIVENYFDDDVLPIISPQIIDPRHPFPNLRNLTHYVVFNLTSATETEVLGLIEVPPSLPGYLVLRGSANKELRYTLLEDVMLCCAAEMFGDYQVVERAVIRVTRNADIDPDEGSFDMEEDYRDHMKRILKQRMRLNPVRLEVQGEFSKSLVKTIRKALELNAEQVYRVSTPMGMNRYVFSLEDLIPPTLAEELVYPHFEPQPSISVNPNLPMWQQIRDHDILLYYPYESMDPFLRLLHESAMDPEVMQIKITLYRVAKKSRLCESLINAAENGVDVTVLMELRARFDEENNIEWAERLEDAGCTVLYGTEGFKVHSKICQITRRCDGEVLRITQLGTGNYNEKTARLYADYSLMTADPRIGEDANRFFRNLQIGNLQGSYSTLGVAPVGLKPLIMRGLNREIEKARNGEHGYCLFKMNSLTDREVIDKISDASCAGVQVDMIIRGISCLLPGIPGKTENVTIHSIVGRMLEHARVYAFGDEFDTMYLSSADMMTRNTEHRVEIAYPILDPAIRERIRSDVQLQFKDNVKGRVLQSNGLYATIPVAPGQPRIDSQATFMQMAEQNTRELEEQLLLSAKKSHKRAFSKSSVSNTKVTGEPGVSSESGSESAARESHPAEVSSEAVSPAAAETIAQGASGETLGQVTQAAGEAGVQSEKTAAAAAVAAAIEAPAPGTCVSPATEATEASARTEAKQSTSDATLDAIISAISDRISSKIDAIDARVESLQSQVDEVQQAASATVEVKATPLSSPDESTEAAGPTPASPRSGAEPAASPSSDDSVQAIELMVHKNGRGSTAWALIRAGFRVLFHGSVKKG